MEGCGRDDLGGRHGGHTLQGLVLSCLVLGRHGKGGPEQGHQPGTGEVWSGLLGQKTCPEPAARAGDQVEI